MRFEDRIPEAYFKNDHYRGRPADFKDKIIGRRIRLVKRIPKFTGNDLDLIDIGCGNGASMFMLSDSFRSCDGIEIEERHKEEFEQYKKAHEGFNCSFKIFDIENSIPSKTYDRLISFEVIEHLTDDHFVLNFYKTLKPGGVAAITVPNKWWIFETHGASLPLLPWNRVPFFSWLPRPLHERWANARIYTKKRIRKVLEEAGFRVASIEYVTAPMDVLKDGWLKSWLVKYIFKNDTTRIPFLATSLFITAYK